LNRFAKVSIGLGNIQICLNMFVIGLDRFGKVWIGLINLERLGKVWISFYMIG
jgi:hypothetical protein